MNPSHTAVFCGVAALVALASPIALAQETGWYGGGNIGRSAATIDDDRITRGLAAGGLGTVTIDDRDRSTGFKLFGGRQLHRNFALEAGLFDLGKFGYTATTNPAGSLDGSIRLRGLNLDAVGILPINERLSALGRIGLTYVQARDSFSGTGSVVVTDPNPRHSGASYKVGAGLQYAMTDALGLRAEVERYRVDDAIGNRGSIDLFSVGLVYRFGGPAPAPRVQQAAAPAYVAPAPVPPPAAVVAPPPPPAPLPVVPPAPRVPVKVSLSSDALFGFDQSVLKPTSEKELQNLVRELGSVKYDAIVVTGHTDRLGSPGYNLKLSTRRAEAVKAELIRSGIAAGVISARGVNGSAPETKPGDCKGSKPTPALIACLQPDRRVEVEVSGTK